MFTSDLALTDATPTTFTYSQISLESNKSIRNDASRGLAYPRSLVISHTVSGAGKKISDRTLVRLNDVREDTAAADGSAQTGSVYLVIDRPRRVVTTAQITSMIDQLKGFLTSGNVTKLLNGEP